jgi:hypothetical protein
MMTSLRSTLSRLFALCAALLLAACASTTLDGTWTRPEFAGKRIQGTVMVVGVARDDTVRRIYEDAMVAALMARGVKAVHSYTALPAALDQNSDERLQQAAQKAGASLILSTAVIGQDRETVVTQDPMVYGGFRGYRGWYGSYWGMSYPVRTEVRTYSIYVAQTALTDVAGDRVEWTARTRTTAPTDVEKETRAFVEVIVGALEKAGLIGPALK